MTDTDTPRRVRVVFCHFTADVCGGSDQSLYDLVTHLPRDRFEAMLVLRRNDPLADKYREAGLHVVEREFIAPRRALDPFKLAAYFWSFLPAVLAVARDVRQYGADVVHVNTLFNLQGAFAAFLARRPLVWHVRELVPGSRLVQFMLWLVSRLATRAVANSHAVLDTLRGCGSRAKVIFNGIDASAFDESVSGDAVRRELNLDPLTPLITVVGRIEPWKGQHVLVEAVPAVLRQRPDACFLIVGGAAVNKPEYLDALKACCRALDIESRVLFAGIRHDIPEILAASNMLALPSVTPEPFGRTLVEAMLAGKPVIATAAGGPLDIVVDGETGSLVPLGNAAALADAILSLADNPERATQMGLRAKERARRHFTLDRVVAEMAAVLEDAAGTRH